jgi:hypothetical protein
MESCLSKLEKPDLVFAADKHHRPVVVIAVMHMAYDIQRVEGDVVDGFFFRKFKVNLHS